MGRLTNQETTIKHFSHPHPLQLTYFDHQNQTPSSECAGCTSPISGIIYTCRLCNYILHTSCAQLPQIISHPFDSQHSLTLLPIPAYENGIFNCDACGGNGTQFCYHCSECGIDLHCDCATMPLSVKHHMHLHPLKLLFWPPYVNRSFSCDICGHLGGNHWLYRCGTCEFDAHLTCTKRSAVTHEARVTQQQHTWGTNFAGNVIGGSPVLQQQPMMVANANNGMFIDQAIIGLGNRVIRTMLNDSGGSGFGIDLGGGVDFGSGFDIGGGDFGGFDSF